MLKRKLTGTIRSRGSHVLRCVFLMSPSITRAMNAGGHVGFKQRKRTGPRFIILTLVSPCSIEIISLNSLLCSLSFLITAFYPFVEGITDGSVMLMDLPGLPFCENRTFVRGRRCFPDDINVSKYRSAVRFWKPLIFYHRTRRTFYYDFGYVWNIHTVTIPLVLHGFPPFWEKSFSTISKIFVLSFFCFFFF